tara:strand:- start:784 stop:1200 length:417 start_codon:yes stop_codon:yes gene_type:complete
MLAYCIRAGMSLSDFWDAEIWEVSAVLTTYFQEKQNEYREPYNVARLQMSAMVDTKNIKFPWERPSVLKEDLTDEQKANLRETSRIMDARAKNEFKAVQILLDLDYHPRIAKELISKASSRRKNIIEPEELVNIAING